MMYFITQFVDSRKVQCFLQSSTEGNKFNNPDGYRKLKFSLFNEGYSFNNNIFYNTDNTNLKHRVYELSYRRYVNLS